MQVIKRAHRVVELPPRYIYIYYIMYYKYNAGYKEGAPRSRAPSSI